MSVVHDETIVALTAARMRQLRKLDDATFEAELTEIAREPILGSYVYDDRKIVGAGDQ